MATPMTETRPIILSTQYYQPANAARREEVELCLAKNIENDLIERIFLFVSDPVESLPEHEKLTYLFLDQRMTYGDWLALSRNLPENAISLLANSDIYFDETVACFENVFARDGVFCAMSRWDVTADGATRHKDPRWSQDVWGLAVRDLLAASDAPPADLALGAIRCDNRIAYQFWAAGWSLCNPVDTIRALHVHETGYRTYSFLSKDNLGPVAYVEAAKGYEESEVDLDLWVGARNRYRSISVNFSVPRKLAEAARNDDPVSVAQLENAPAAEASRAISHGSVAARWGRSLEVREHAGAYYFINSLAPGAVRKTPASPEILQDADIVLCGLTPPSLTAVAQASGTDEQGSPDGFFFQYPAATERQAVENHASIRAPAHIDDRAQVIHCYVPIPWATLIDRRRLDHPFLDVVAEQLEALRKLAQGSRFDLRFHSVCQHIRWPSACESVSRLGLTDFHISHKTTKSRAPTPGFALRAWPLIAVNYEVDERSTGLNPIDPAERRILASFVGAHMEFYLKEDRLRLKELGETLSREDVVIEVTSEWHFQKQVYRQQLTGDALRHDEQRRLEESTRAYNELLSDSKFSFCPVGSGPNTLRLWESIAIGTVPVLFEDTLGCLYDLPMSSVLRDNCVIWRDEIGPALIDHLAQKPLHEIRARSAVLRQTYELLRDLRGFA